MLTHPEHGNDEYRKNVTGGSILYPVVALQAALLNDEGQIYFYIPSALQNRIVPHDANDVIKLQVRHKLVDLLRRA